MADPILRVESLSKSFGGLVAADQITLQIDQGSITGLIGPNGSGKTTLFNLVSGALKPDGGRVLFRNSDITGLRPHQVFKKGVYRTFQSPQIIPRLLLSRICYLPTELKLEKVYSQLCSIGEGGRNM